MRSDNIWTANTKMGQLISPMIRTSTWFKFVPPLDWSESNEQGRLVYRSPKGEALIVSATGIAGSRSETEEEEVRGQLLQNAFDAMVAAASKPDLKVIRKLRSDERVRGVECWTLEAETLDSRAVFLQSVFRNGMGILFVTFEAHNCTEAKLKYERFLTSVEANNRASGDN